MDAGADDLAGFEGDGFVVALSLRLALFFAEATASGLVEPPPAEEEAIFFYKHGRREGREIGVRGMEDRGQNQ